MGPNRSPAQGAARRVEACGHCSMDLDPPMAASWWFHPGKPTSKRRNRIWLRFRHIRVWVNSKTPGIGPQIPFTKVPFWSPIFDTQPSPSFKQLMAIHCFSLSSRLIMSATTAETSPRAGLKHHGSFTPVSGAGRHRVLSGKATRVHGQIYEFMKPCPVNCIKLNRIQKEGFQL